VDDADLDSVFVGRGEMGAEPREIVHEVEGPEMGQGGEGGEDRGESGGVMVFGWGQGVDCVQVNWRGDDFNGGAGGDGGDGDGGV
jgi:hypothetical protein